MRPERLRRQKPKTKALLAEPSGSGELFDGVLPLGPGGLDALRSKRQKGPAGKHFKDLPGKKVRNFMHQGMTIHESVALVQRVIRTEGDYESRMAEINAAYAQVQLDLLTAKTPKQFAALSILEFSLLSESVRLMSTTGEFAQVAR